MTGHTRFIRLWSTSLLVLVLLTVGLNVMVDPYEVFGTPRIPHVNLLKPAAKNHAMLAKTYQVVRVRPKTVVIGSSPVYIGIDAFDPAWPARMRPVYNYGIPGGYATSTGLNTLQEAWYAGGLENVVVFLDFQNFFVPEQPNVAVTEDDRRFHLLPDGRLNPLRKLQVARDMFLASATMGTLIDSAITFAGQGNAGLLNLAQDGSATASDFINAAHNDGMYDLFAQKHAFEAERVSLLQQKLAQWNGPLPNVDTVASFIALAEAHHLHLILVIAPHHSDGMELYWHAGLWQRVEQLKMELAVLTARHTETVTLWDFMDYSDFATEFVPRPGDRTTPTKWFWEPTHFKKTLGSIMIKRMADPGTQAFGERLTPDNAQARNDEVRAQRKALICEGRQITLDLISHPGNKCPPGLDAAAQRGPT